MLLPKLTNLFSIYFSDKKDRNKMIENKNKNDNIGLEGLTLKYKDN